MRIPASKKESRKQKGRASLQNGEPPVAEHEPVHAQPASPSNDVQARTAQRAYEIYLNRRSRPGDAVSDWLEAEREVLAQECNA